MAIVTSGLVGEWVGKLAKTGTAPGNNTDPTGTWDDLTGSHDGTLSTFAYTSGSGWVGAGTAGNPYALQYDGASDIVNCGGVSDFNSLSALTIEAWVYVPASNGASYPRIVSKDDTGSTTGFAFYIAGGSRELGCKVMVGSVMYDSNFTNAILGSAAWGHAVLTFDSADAMLRCYMNNVAQTTISTGAGNIITSTAPLCIGNRYADSARPWFGAFATVRLYNKALSASEVSQNYVMGILAASTDAAASSDRTSLIQFGVC